MSSQTQPTLKVQPGPDLDLNRPFRSRLVTMDDAAELTDGRGIRIDGTHARRFDRANSTGLEGLFGDGPLAAAAGERREPYRLVLELLRPDLVHVVLDTAPGNGPAAERPAARVVTPAELALRGVTADAPSVRITRDAEEIVTESEATRIRFLPRSLTFTVERGGSLVLAETSAASSVYWGYFAYPAGTIERDGRVHTTVAFARRRDEDYYGLGEQFTDLNKRRQRVDLYNRDPANTLTNRTYITVPFFVSTGGYGLLINSYAPATVDLGSSTNEAIAVEMEGTVLDYYILLGSPAEVLRLYHRMTGPPAVPPLWSYGLWLSTIRRYRSDAALIKVADEIRRRRFPCDVVHVDPPWMGTDLTCTLEWGPDFLEKDAMIARLKERHLRLCLWIAPYVPTGSSLYEEGLSQGFFLRDANGVPVVNEGPMNFWSVPFVYVDFTNPGEAAWIKTWYRRLFDDGVDVLKVDLGELGPEEAVYRNGMVGREGHNYYTLAYQRTVYEATAEARERAVARAVANGHPEAPLIWCRSGTAGSQRYPVHWAGDVACDFENMAGQLRAILSAGMSGFVFFSHDIGGFTGRPEPELYVRWFQFAMFTSHARAHGGEPHEPWEYGEEAESACRRYALLRYSLLPHIYDASHRAAAIGEPLVKPLVLDYPDDPNLRNVDDEYLFCDTFLVAPVFAARGQRRVYLPAGIWWDFWSGERAESRGEWIAVECGIDDLPVWVRDGSLVLRCEPGEYVDAAAMTASLYVQLFGDPPEAGRDVVLPDGTTVRLSIAAADRVATLGCGPAARKLAVRPAGGD